VRASRTTLPIPSQPLFALSKFASKKVLFYQQMCVLFVMQMATSLYRSRTDDRPLIVQFGAKTAHDLAVASQYVANDCDGIDINCGCPQRWAIQEGIGCALLTKPELVAGMVRDAKNASGLPVSIKIRIDNDTSKTVELARRAEAMGASWVTVHGRTSRMKSTHPVNYDAVKTVRFVQKTVDTIIELLF